MSEQMVGERRVRGYAREVALLGFFIVFISSIVYLATRRLLWDVVAHSAAELGVLFCSIVLLTGPIWARPVWGTWWTWEARLTTTLVLEMVFVAKPLGCTSV